MFLGPGWFAVVMGLCGLALAWRRASAWWGEAAVAASVVIALLAALVFVVLAAASVARAWRHPHAWSEDLRHPVRHPFVAAIPVAMLLLATAAQALVGHAVGITVLWMVGAATQFAATVWVLSRWIAPAGLAWPSITPVLFIPVVGNVLTALGGVALGQSEWAAAQFAIGVVMWPVVLALLAVRIGLHGLWPERLLPTTFITIAPPAVIGLGLLQWGAPVLLAWACWGAALFFLAWSATVLPRLARQDFGVSFWGLSFPLAAFASLTLALAASAGEGWRVLALTVLVLVTLVIAGLAIGTVRGLARGTLLVPEAPPGQGPSTTPSPTSPTTPPVTTSAAA